PSVAAALATLEVLTSEPPYERIYHYGAQLIAGLKTAANKTNQNLVVQGFGPIVHTGFSDHGPAREYRDVLRHDKAKLGRFVAGLHDHGIRVIGRGLWYVSAAHTEDDITRAIDVAGNVLGTL